MYNKSHNQRQEKSLIINRLARQMSEENEEIFTPELQQQEDVQYVQNLLQVCFACFDDAENN